MTKKILLLTLVLALGYAALLTLTPKTTPELAEFKAIEEMLQVSDAYAQAGEARSFLPLTIKYKNGRTDRDTCSETADTLRFGVLGKGGLAPVGIIVQFTAEDADVSATPDSFDVTFRAGIGGRYATVGSKTLTISGTLPGVASRTLVFNTSGASTALNTQAAVWPYCDAVELWLENGSGGTTAALNDSLRYTVKAYGVYESGRFAATIPVIYWNKGKRADSALGTTVDTTRIGITQFGDASPLGVGVLIYVKDVDVSNTDATDSLLVASFGSIDGRNVYNLGTGTFFSEAAPVNRSTAAPVAGTRTYVFNTTGAATARNTQATLSPYFRTLELRSKADDSGDTTYYEYKVLGIYRKN